MHQAYPHYSSAHTLCGLYTSLNWFRNPRRLERNTSKLNISLFCCHLCQPASSNSQPDICRTWTKFVHKQYLYFLIGMCRNNNNNNNNNARTIFMVLPSCLKHCESSPWFTWWVQHGARWPPTFGPSRSAGTISPPVGCQLTTLAIAILLLLSP